MSDDDRCPETHPDHPGVRCAHGAAARHSEHSAEGPTGWVYWKNKKYRESSTTAKQISSRKHHHVTSIRNGIDVTGEVPDSARRNVGRSSVTSSTPTERSEGAARAGNAVEPDFAQAWAVAVRIVAEGVERFTTDPIWDLLDAAEIFTEHPKASKALMDHAIKDGIIKRVPLTDPDSQRSSSRTNSSRKIGVYESLVCRAS